MKYKEAKKLNNIYSLILFIAITIIIALIMYLSKNTSFWGDDIEFSIYITNEKLFDCLFSQIHGSGYIGAFLSKFLSYKLPLLLNIHPSDFMTNGLGFIKGILTVITIFSISNLINIYSKSKQIYTFAFILISIYFFYGIYTTYTWVPYITYNYFRYFFSFFFLAIFIKNTYEVIIKKQTTINTKKLILASVCGFILGTSIEISFFTAITIFFGTLFYNAILKLLKKDNLTYKLNLNFYIPNIFLIAAILLFTFTQGFQEVSATRGMNNIHIDWNILKEFSGIYYKYCIGNELIFWILFIILLVTAFKIAIKKDEIKKLNFIIIYTISMLTVMFSLILCGKTCNMAFEHELTYFIEHVNIIFLYKMLLVIPFTILVAYISSKLGNYKKFIYYLLITIILALSVNFIFDKNKETYKSYKANYLQLKQRELYIIEKIIRYYLLTNEPIMVYTIDDFFFLYDKDCKCIGKEGNLAYYYANIYQDYRITNIAYCRSENAIEEFYNKGGRFEVGELQNIKFNNLKDDDFILNKSEKSTKILTPEEVKKLLTLDNY